VKFVIEVPKVAAHNLRFVKGNSMSIQKLNFHDKGKENEQTIGHFT